MKIIYVYLKCFSKYRRMAFSFLEYFFILEIMMFCIMQIRKVMMSWNLPTSFPGSSLFLPRESTLVAAGHVAARFLQIAEMWLKGGAGKLPCLLSPVGSTICNPPILDWQIDTFDIGVQSVAFSWIFPVDCWTVFGICDSENILQRT